MTLRHRLLCGVFAASTVVIGAPVMAATATDTAQEAAAPSTAVGDVVITARKTQENLQRVPIAVTAQTGRQLEQQRIVQAVELGRIVPSLRTFWSSSSDNSAQLALRGQVASDTLIGISQPIGLYEDTVNIPHPFGANAAFFDLSRVEVLKGPQGTLYGRNTTGGAINIITHDADFNGWHGFAMGEVGTSQHYKWGGAVNIPLIADQLAVRIAYQRWDKRGFASSAITHQDLGDDHHDNVLRVSIRWNPLDNVRGNFKMEYSDTHHTAAFIANTSICGLVSGSLTCNPQQAPANFAALTFNQRRGLMTVAPNAAYFNNALATNPLTNVALVRQAVLNGDANAFNQVLANGVTATSNCQGFTYTNCIGIPVFDNLHTWHGVGDISWDITPDITLRSITGYHSFTDWKNGDLDAMPGQILEIGAGSAATNGVQPSPAFGPKPLPFPLKADQESGQFSQEFDLSGKNLFGRINWLVGAYLSVDRGHGAQNQLFGSENAMVFGCAAANTTTLDPNQYCTGPFVASDHDGIAIDNKTWAIFTQNDFKIFEWANGGSFSITGGGRYTHEHLTNMLSNWDYNYYSNTLTCEAGTLVSGQIATTTVGLPLPVAGQPDSCAYANNANSATQASAGGPGGIFNNAVFTGWSYLFSANVQINRDMLFYVNTARGFRGGAYGRTNSPAAQPEIAVNYEVGFKADFFEHRLRVNLAAYQTDYTNKQVSVQTCVGGAAPPCPAGVATSTAVVNAATARMRGFEAEIITRPIEGLQIYGNMSYLNAIYTKWLPSVSGEGNVLCTIRPDLSGLILNPATGAPITAAQCASPPPGVTVPNPTSNANGIPLAISPDWQANIGGRYEHPIGPGVGAVQVDWQYIGATPVTAINHQIGVPLATEQFERRAVGLLNARLEFMLPEQGLTVAVWGSNLGNVYYGIQGISSGFTGGVGHYVLYPPRQIGITITKKFGRD